MPTNSSDSSSDPLSREADVRPEPQREASGADKAREDQQEDANPLTTDVPDKLVEEGVPSRGDDVGDSPR